VRARNAEEVRQPAEALLAAVNVRLDGAGYVSSAGRAAAGLLDAPPLPVGEAPERIAIEPKVAQLPELISAVRDGLAAARAIEECGHAVLAAANARLAGVERDLAEVLRDAGQADVAALLAAAGEASQRAATARQDLERATANRDRSVHLDEVLAVGEPFIQNLDVIVAAMRPGAFLQHLLKSREMELLAEATRRLRAITNGRFGFVADFGVVNLASGEVRSPDSLSGGERFQAALALALALVEIASRGAGRLDAVFVDEGFGSLDASALDMALATLGSVAGGGKTVALISHLRPVAEYVETVLHVTRSDVVGSRIERLGPDARDQLLADDIRSGLTA
jgi:exonuclease SbcC